MSNRLVLHLMIWRQDRVYLCISAPVTPTLSANTILFSRFSSAPKRKPRYTFVHASWPKQSHMCPVPCSGIFWVTKDNRNSNCMVVQLKKKTDARIMQSLNFKITDCFFHLVLISVVFLKPFNNLWVKFSTTGVLYHYQ